MICSGLVLCAALSCHAQVILNGWISDDTPQPAPGFSVPKADSKTIDKLDDLDRYIAKKAWELAFRAVNDIDVEGAGMAPGAPGSPNKGFFFPIARRVSESLLHLSPEGRDSYRLFNDASAKQAWEKLQNARSPANAVIADEATALRKMVDHYFLTSIGDLAADRLGDVLFEQGNASEALGVWDSIVEKYPDPHVAVVKVQVKRCVALAELHRRDELAQLAATIKETYAGQKVTIGGEDVDAATFAESLLTTEADTQPATQPLTMPANTAAQDIVLSHPDTPAWQIRVTSFNATDRMQQQISNWGTEVHFDGSTPPAAADDKRLYVNWFGITYAADLQTGKMLWRTKKFDDITNNVTMFPQYSVNPDHFSISCADGKVFTLGFDPVNAQRQDGGYQLECFDGATGKSLWKGSTLGSVLSAPLVVDGVGYVLAVKDREDMQCLAINLATGKSDAAISLGKPQVGSSNYGGQTFAMPTVLAMNGMLYVATNNGALVAVDLRGKRVAWAFQNDTKKIDTDRGYWGQTPRVFETPCTLLSDAGTLYIKDTAAPGLYAIEPENPKLDWRRTVSSEEMVAGVQGQTAFLLGASVSALDLKTRRLLWSTKIPVATGLIQAVVRPAHIYVATQRGIFDIDPANGDVLHIYRGADKDSPGGRLMVASDKLICVTDSAVTAYAIQAGSAAK